MFLSFLVMLLLNVLTLGVFSFVIVGIVWILEIFAYWNVLKKMGEPGWKSFIPIYNNYVLYKHIWGTNYFFMSLGVNIVKVLVDEWKKTDSGSLINATKTITGILATVVAFLFSIVFCMKLAASFGRSKLFGVGLLLLSPLFMMILAYGDSEYLGDGDYQLY